MAYIPQSQEIEPVPNHSPVRAFVDYHADQFESHCDGYGFPYFMLQDIHKGFAHDLEGFLETIPQIPCPNIIWDGLDIDAGIEETMGRINSHRRLDNLSNVQKQSIAISEFIDGHINCLDPDLAKDSPKDAIIRLKAASTLVRRAINTYFDERGADIHLLDFQVPLGEFISQIGIVHEVDEPAIRSIFKLGDIQLHRSRNSHVSYAYSAENPAIYHIHSEPVTPHVSMSSRFGLEPNGDFNFNITQYLNNGEGTELMLLGLKQGHYQYKPSVPINIPKFPIPVNKGDGKSNTEIDYREVDIAYIDVKVMPEIYRNFKALVFGLYNYDQRGVTHECHVQSNIKGHSDITLVQVEHMRNWKTFPYKVLAQSSLSSF